MLRRVEMDVENQVFNPASRRSHAFDHRLDLEIVLRLVRLGPRDGESRREVTLTGAVDAFCNFLWGDEAARGACHDLEDVPGVGGGADVWKRKPLAACNVGRVLQPLVTHIAHIRLTTSTSTSTSTPKHHHPALRHLALAGNLQLDSILSSLSSRHPSPPAQRLFSSLRHFTIAYCPSTHLIQLSMPSTVLNSL